MDRPAETAGEALATGYSCRSQVKRMAHRQLRHPLQVLLARVRVGDEGRAGTEGAEPLLNNDQNK